LVPGLRPRRARDLVRTLFGPPRCTPTNVLGARPAATAGLYLYSMDNLPPFDINRLTELRDLGERRQDAASRFIGSECRVAAYAYIQSSNASARGEPIGAMQFLRLFLEAIIRVRWLAGDQDLGDADGQLVVDRATVIERVRRLTKRDLLNLRAAYVAINQSTGRKGQYVGGLTALVDGIPDVPAPATVRELAVARSARATYAAHRLYSSRIHPGALLGRMAVEETADEIDSQLEASGYMFTAWADASLRAVGERSV
jgi:hypothetical protein